MSIAWFWSLNLQYLVYSVWVFQMFFLMGAFVDYTKRKTSTNWTCFDSLFKVIVEILNLSVSCLCWSCVIHDPALLSFRCNMWGVFCSNVIFCVAWISYWINIWLDIEHFAHCSCPIWGTVIACVRKYWSIPCPVGSPRWLVVCL